MFSTLGFSVAKHSGHIKLLRRSSTPSGSFSFSIVLTSCIRLKPSLLLLLPPPPPLPSSPPLPLPLLLLPFTSTSSVFYATAAAVVATLLVVRRCDRDEGPSQTCVCSSSVVKSHRSLATVWCRILSENTKDFNEIFKKIPFCSFTLSLSRRRPRG